MPGELVLISSIGISSTVVAHHSWPALQKTTHAWCCKPDQEPMIGEVMGTRGEPNHTILLSGYSIKMLPKCLSLELWIDAIRCQHQRDFFLQVRGLS